MDKLGIRIRAIVLASMVLIWGGRTFAQINHSIDESEANTGENQDERDRRFVTGALEGGMVEVQLGQLALQKSSNSQVKQFAQKMIDDHGQMNNEMTPVAKRLGVPISSQLNKKDQKNLAKLSALSGSEFDQVYIKETVKDHKAELGEYHDEVSSFKTALNVDPNLRTAASDGTGMINGHLQMAEQLGKDQNAK